MRMPRVSARLLTSDGWKEDAEKQVSDWIEKVPSGKPTDKSSDNKSVSQ